MGPSAGSIDAGSRLDGNGDSSMSRSSRAAYRTVERADQAGLSSAKSRNGSDQDLVSRF